LDFPKIQEHSLEWIWRTSPAFNRFRGYDWMKQPCRSCPEREKDFGGCRCQAYLLSGDPANADPACELSPHHHLVQNAVEVACRTVESQVDTALVFRTPKNSRALSTPR
jgi:pyrroloquinoline quinone biosynthesis protein E